MSRTHKRREECSWWMRSASAFMLCAILLSINSLASADQPGTFSSTVVHRTSLGTERATGNDSPSSLSGLSGLSGLSRPTEQTKQTRQTEQTKETVKHDTSFGRLPLSFERNAGQADDTVQFLARGKGRT